MTAGNKRPQQDIHRSTFYNWLQRYRDAGVDGLTDMKPVTDSKCCQIPAVHHTAFIDLALADASSLKNLTPADMFFKRGQEILEQREKTKLVTWAMRRRMHHDNQARQSTRMS